MLAVFFAVVSVLIYIWLRFEWQFALGAVFALIHDVILTVGVFSILRYEFNLSIIFIAHDLSVVKHISDRVGVMNLGQLVEINFTQDIFNNPKHSYTKELLRAIPEPNPIGREERKAKRLSN